MYEETFIITLISVFRPFTEYLVEAPLAAITASGDLGYDATSFAHLDLEIFCHYSLRILKLCPVGFGQLDSHFPGMLDWVTGPCWDAELAVR